MLPTQWIDKIHQGDCLELLHQLPSRSIGLIVTSPPFNLGNSTGNGDRVRYDSWTDAMPHEDYVAWQRDCLTEMMRVLRPEGAIFYHHKDRVQGGLEQNRSDILEGFPLRQTIIWARDGGQNHNPGYFLPTHEYIYMIVPSRRAFELARIDRGHGTVWKVRQDTRNPYPGSYPVEIPYRCIAGVDAEVVLDPFMGSGTTALAAVKAGRRYLGFEISEYACHLARRRIAAIGKDSTSRIITYLTQHGAATREAIRQATGLAKRTVMLRLADLQAEGLLAVTVDPADRRRRFFALKARGTRREIHQISISAGDPGPRIHLIAEQQHPNQTQTQNRCNPTPENGPGCTYLGENRCNPTPENGPGCTYLGASEHETAEISGVSSPAPVKVQAITPPPSSDPGKAMHTPETERPACPEHGSRWTTPTRLRGVQDLDAEIGTVTWLCTYDKRCSFRWNANPNIGCYRDAGDPQRLSATEEVALRRDVQPGARSRQSQYWEDYEATVGQAATRKGQSYAEDAAKFGIYPARQRGNHVC